MSVQELERVTQSDQSVLGDIQNPAEHLVLVVSALSRRVGLDNPPRPRNSMTLRFYIILFHIRL